MTDPHQSPLRIPTPDLRRHVDATQFAFATTREVEPQQGISGQDEAVEALRFGLQVHAPGQNIYVRGLTGTGRLELVRRIIHQIEPLCPLAQDRCYVHNFQQPDRPKLLSLPRGMGRAFARRIDQLSTYIRQELIPALSDEPIQAKARALETAMRQSIDSSALEKDLAQAGLAMVPIQNGEEVGTAIVPLHEGKPVSPEAYEALRKEGKVQDEEAERLRQALVGFRERFREFTAHAAQVQADHAQALRNLFESEARRLMQARMNAIAKEFPSKGVACFLNAILEDVVEILQVLGDGEEDPTDRYEVNVLVNHSTEGCPVVVENTPTLRNLLGNIDRSLLPGGRIHSDHMMIQGGSLLRAESGFLILNAMDLLSEPGAWKMLVRTLRTGKLEIVPHDLGILGGGSPLSPEPIDINVKVVLIGESSLYYALDSGDPDFSALFKVLADFEGDFPLNHETMMFYAHHLSGLAERESLPPFTREAVAALCEHGTRISGRNDRLTTKFARLNDLAREAAYINTVLDPTEAHTTGEHVRRAIENTRRRAGRPSQRFRESIADGTLRIETRGAVIGQINGLAVMSAGPLTFGFPARITATAGPGMRGVVDIERESSLSGSIHTKGFHILGGLLRHLFRTRHPLAFTASLAFEQSYGGVDGDSASGAETCCLLSALTGIPIRQNLAMTGAIDQFGNIQPIGGASEKIEGFFATCLDAGLTGDQGVLLPAANKRNLVLRQDVVEACDAGRFHIYAIDRIEQAIELLTGVPAGTADADGQFAEGTVFAKAMEMLGEYWYRSRGMEREAAPSKSENEAPDA
ncbi:MAG: AAA family ATPase [Planctomycetes bacterium]|nr:AAA family ATPase [Planctomycetota bacterium]MCB9911120.1 AAA family ATPase [Planctomycetota bacterium]MCB9912147.1 AAA family ATPase [Planctomycetota bacterium]HPF12827.1 ATP-binding protein [Planctomycetota bacterium]